MNSSSKILALLALSALGIPAFAADLDKLAHEKIGVHAEEVLAALRTGKEQKLLVDVDISSATSRMLAERESASAADSGAVLDHYRTDIAKLKSTVFDAAASLGLNVAGEFRESGTTLVFVHRAEALEALLKIPAVQAVNPIVPAAPI